MSGESYAGHYPPIFASAVYDMNTRLQVQGKEAINLRSVMIGNVMVNLCESPISTHLPSLFRRILINLHVDEQASTVFDIVGDPRSFRRHLLGPQLCTEEPSLERTARSIAQSAKLADELCSSSRMWSVS
jgi:hypothetical protein